MSGAALPPATPPPAAPPSGAGGRSPVPLADVTIQSLPPKLAFLSHGVTVSGQVVAQQDGAATIRTPAGDVVVKTPVPLPTDRPVQLQIPGGQVQAQPQRAVALTPQTAASTPAAQATGTTASAATVPSPAQQAAVAQAQGQAQGQAAPRAGRATQGGAAPATAQTGAAVADGTARAEGQDLPTLRPNLPVRATVLALPPVVTPAVPAGTAQAQATTAGQAPSAAQPQTGQAPAGPASPPTPPPQAPASAPPPAPTSSPVAGAGGGGAVTGSGTATATAGAGGANATATPALPATGSQPFPPPPGGAAASAPQAPPGSPATLPAASGGASAGSGGGAGNPSASPTSGTSSPPAGGASAAPTTRATPASPGTDAAEDLLRVPVSPRAARAEQARAEAADRQALPPGRDAASARVASPAPALAARLLAQAAAGADAPPSHPGQQSATAPAVTAAGQPLALAPGQSFQVRLLPTAQPTGALPTSIPVTDGGSVPPDTDPAALPAAPSPTSRPVLSGTVAGSTAAGQTIVTTPAGTLVLQARSTLPPGTPVQLAVDPATAQAALAASAIDILHGRDWPALKDVMAILAALDPALARQVANTAIPQPNRRLTTNLVFLLSAIRGGDAGGWLGDAASAALEGAGRRDLLGRLSEDMRTMSRQAAEPLPDGWTVFPLPFGEADALGRLQFYVRRGAGDDDTAEGGGRRGGGRSDTRRFVIDVEFTRLGAMQLDGLVWPGHLDLMLRTRDLLPQRLKAEIGAIFRGSLEAVGFAGTLGFQTGAHAWVTIRRGGGQVSA